MLILLNMRGNWKTQPAKKRFQCVKGFNDVKRNYFLANYTGDVTDKNIVINQLGSSYRDDQYLPEVVFIV